MGGSLHARLTGTPHATEPAGARKDGAFSRLLLLLTSGSACSVCRLVV